MSVAAVWMTWDVVDQMVKPGAACERNIPLFEGLYVSETKRAWPPPFIHFSTRIWILVRRRFADPQQRCR